MRCFLSLVLFSAVVYGHGLSRVRTSDFGFVSEQLIANRFDFSKSHALVAVKIATRVAARDQALDEDWKLEKLNRETRALSGGQIDAILFNRDGTLRDEVKPPVAHHQIFEFNLVRLNDCPVTMFPFAKSHGWVATERANVADHSELDVCASACDDTSVRLLLSLAFFSDTFRTPMVRTFRVLDRPACFECGGIGCFLIGEVSGNTLIYGNAGQSPNVKESIGQKRDTRFALFIHEPLTATTQNTERHGEHYSPERVRKQGPSVLVLLSSAKTKNIAILKKHAYTFSCEVEELSHRTRLLPFNGDSVPSLLCGVDQWKVNRSHKPKVAGSNPVPATNLTYPTTMRNGQSGSAEPFRKMAVWQAEGVKGVEVECPPDLLAGVGKS